MIEKNQNMLYNLFDWPSRENSKLLVILISNTIDLVDWVLKPKIRSRIGMSRVSFTPYTQPQIVSIVKQRLDIREHPLCVGKDVGMFKYFQEDALTILSKKAASFSGDIRKVLSACSASLLNLAKRIKKEGVKRCNEDLTCRSEEIKNYESEVDLSTASQNDQKDCQTSSCRKESKLQVTINSLQRTYTKLFGSSMAIDILNHLNYNQKLVIMAI